MSRMSPHQNFLGFASQGSVQNIRVEIQAELILTTLEGEAFPPLLVRLVPGQHDDLLVAAPDLDKWGWDRETDPLRFHFKRLGLTVPRSTVAPDVMSDDDDLPNLVSAKRVRITISSLTRR